jgi:hypothetical protein
VKHRLLGIIGPGRGPWISTSSLTSPKAKIIGLKDGVVRVICGHSPDAEDTQCVEIGVCGMHEVPEARFMRVEYDGPNLIVCTLHGVAVAIS